MEQDHRENYCFAYEQDFEGVLLINHNFVDLGSIKWKELRFLKTDYLF